MFIRLPRRKTVEGRFRSVISGGGFLLFRVQSAGHQPRRLLRRHVEVRVNVSGGAEVRVPQPDLNLLHRDAVRQQERGCRMTKVVEADFDRVLLFATGFDQRIC